MLFLREKTNKIYIFHVKYLLFTHYSYSSRIYDLFSSIHCAKFLDVRSPIGLRTDAKLPTDATEARRDFVASGGNLALSIFTSLGEKCTWE